MDKKKVLTVEADVDLLGDGGCGVGVGGLAHQLGPEVLAPQAGVEDAVGDGAGGRDLVAAVEDAALAPPRHRGQRPAPTDLAGQPEVVTNLGAGSVLREKIFIAPKNIWTISITDTNQLGLRGGIFLKCSPIFLSNSGAHLLIKFHHPSNFVIGVMDSWFCIANNSYKEKLQLDASFWLQTLGKLTSFYWAG